MGSLLFILGSSRFQTRPQAGCLHLTRNNKRAQHGRFVSRSFGSRGVRGKGWQMGLRVSARQHRQSPISHFILAFVTALSLFALAIISHKADYRKRPPQKHAPG